MSIYQHDETISGDMMRDDVDRDETCEWCNECSEHTTDVVGPTLCIDCAQDGGYI